MVSAMMTVSRSPTGRLTVGWVMRSGSGQRGDMVLVEPWLVGRALALDRIESRPAVPVRAGRGAGDANTGTHHAETG
jgi:hypothetical protein